MLTPDLAISGIVSVSIITNVIHTVRRRGMHIPNKFTVIRIFLVFNQCRIRSDTRRADRRLSTVVFAVLCSRQQLLFLERGDIRSDLAGRGRPAPGAVKRCVNCSVAAFRLRCRLRPAACEM